MSSKTPHTKPTPSWLVERIALDEAPASFRSDQLSDAEQSDLEHQLCALRKSNQEILERYPVDTTVCAIQRRIQRARAAQDTQPSTTPWWTSLQTYAPALATLSVVCVALVLFLAQPSIDPLQPRTIPPSPEPSTPQPAAPRTAPVDPGNRIKGSARIHLFRRSGNTATPLSNGSLVAQGDILQIRYTPAQHPYGVIASVDGNRNVTLHFPSKATLPTDLQPKGDTLPFAYELDDAPRFERFFFVTSSKPIHPGEIVQTLSSFVLHTKNDEEHTPTFVPHADGPVHTVLLRKSNPPAP